MSQVLIGLSHVAIAMHLLAFALIWQPARRRFLGFEADDVNAVVGAFWDIAPSASTMA